MKKYKTNFFIKKLMDIFLIVAITLLVVLILSLIYKFFFIRLNIDTESNIKDNNVIEKHEENIKEKSRIPHSEKLKNTKKVEIIAI